MVLRTNLRSWARLSPAYKLSNIRNEFGAFAITLPERFFIAMWAAEILEFDILELGRQILEIDGAIHHIDVSGQTSNCMGWQCLFARQFVINFGMCDNLNACSVKINQDFYSNTYLSS